jgi:hypothetical protein
MYKGGTNGLPVVYDLVPANSDERLAAETVVAYLQGCHIFGDKGFIEQKQHEKLDDWLTQAD